MKFLVDNQLPVALVLLFISHGFHAEHVLNIKMEEATDRSIWQYAVANQMLMVSKDEDFVYLASATGAKSQLVWIRLGNCRNEDLFAAFETAMPELTDALEQGHPVVEIC